MPDNNLQQLKTGQVGPPESDVKSIPRRSLLGQYEECGLLNCYHCGEEFSSTAKVERYLTAVAITCTVCGCVTPFAYAR